MQLILRKKIIDYKSAKYSAIWPVNSEACIPPEGWQGWPEGRKFALILSHDVETKKGYNQVEQLIKIEEQYGFRSTFNFVPERYGQVSVDLINRIKARGFGVGVHGLHHDGKLFHSRKVFDKRAKKINSYLKRWNVNGFTSPAMHRNFDWMHVLEVSHCISTFDTDPFEPQPDAAGTIFPFCVQNGNPENAWLELPYTLPQDFTLFILMQEKNINIWKDKLDWIASKGGMALLISHPDYMNFNGNRLGLDEYSVKFYEDFLKYIKKKHGNSFWHALTAELANYMLKQNKIPQKRQILT
jgi:peptidoglycan/xylan/chitin deacetylase (PgdA/CDA1 family)